ncbi:hypothetical protein HF325_002751 [Metschnikowia pulcherrima]|uniref:Actin-related protein 2/3 complex subunit 5 n=1 Tax=Metschnikowia pulcherrima TaxID=27326 RepID=A0A8H7LB39_9ASCO|nr:hypothetical protein HF325_002751 [Metschnikowia pulcherrima]
MEDWRRIDIDALEPENHLSKQDLVPDLPPTALDTPPYVSDQKTKNLHTETVFEVLASIKNNHNINEFPTFVSQLSSDQQDTLIKYIYKIMSTNYGAKHGALLLSWFEKTVDVTGMGPVVRFYSDRRTV